MNRLKRDAIERALRLAHESVEKEAVPIEDQQRYPDDAYLALVLFNIQAVDGEGHTILALGPINGDLMSYSYYRPGEEYKGPARMAKLKEPESFADLRSASGWLLHGNPPDNWWNEHVDAALAISMEKETFDPISAYAEKTAKDPGIYDFLTHNCLDFVEDALAQGNVHLISHTGGKLHHIAPRDAFEATMNVEGAHKYGSWKYWFDAPAAPQNGYRVIPAL